MTKWFTDHKIPISFMPIPASGYSQTSAKFAYAGLNKLTQAEKDANFAKFMSEFQSQIDATFAKGSCSKAQVYDIGRAICPFG